jgi:hypothetical protein
VRWLGCGDGGVEHGAQQVARGWLGHGAVSSIFLWVFDRNIVQSARPAVIVRMHESSWHLFSFFM